MQQVPRCFGCEEPVEHDPIFEAPCGQGHERCFSVVWHPLCLMRHREHLDTALRAVETAIERLQQDHCPHGHQRGCGYHECDE